MKIFIAATAPSHETGKDRVFLPVLHRLLSFHFISTKGMGQDEVLEDIIEHNRKVSENEDQ